MRVYLPSTLNAVAALQEKRETTGGIGWAVTPALRESYESGDSEELEYAVLARAAQESLELLSDDVRAPRRRVVLVAEVPDDAVVAAASDTDALSPDPGEVRVNGTIAIRSIEAVHVDEPESVALVRAALIDPEDTDALGELEDAHLLWYATQEIDELVAPA
jgi:hypothetical protein